MLHTYTTNQAYTFEALGGFLMNNNEVNAESLADNVEVTCMNDRNSYDYMTERRKSGAFVHTAEAVAVYWLCSWINAEMHYCYGHNYSYCTYKQVKRFNDLHNKSIDKVLKLLTEIIEAERKELDRFD